MVVIYLIVENMLQLLFLYSLHNSRSYLNILLDIKKYHYYNMIQHLEQINQ